MNSYFLVLTRKNKSREPFLLKIRFCGFPACARLSLHIETIQKWSYDKCLLSVFGWPDGNIYIWFAVI